MARRGASELPGARTYDGPVKLVTIDEGDVPSPETLKGCIVRVRPRAGESEDPEFVDWLEKVRDSALRVVLLPSLEEKPLPEAARASAPRAEDARKVVEAMVEAANVEDKIALKALCERTLAEVGL